MPQHGSVLPATPAFLRLQAGREAREREQQAALLSQYRTVGGDGGNSGDPAQQQPTQLAAEQVLSGAVISQMRE